MYIYCHSLQKSKDEDDVRSNSSASSSTNYNKPLLIKMLDPGTLPILYSAEILKERVAMNVAAMKAKRDSGVTKKENNDESNEIEQQEDFTIVTPAKFVPRTIIMKYFKECIEMMEHPTIVAQIVEQSWITKLPLHLVSMQFQRDFMENNYQIEKNFGCKHISMLPATNPEDTELISGASEFMFSALKCFIYCLKLRAKLYYSGKKRSSGGMSRESMMEFFEGK